MMENSKASSLGSYASNRATAFINYNEDNKSIIEIWRVFAEYKDNVVVIDGENKTPQRVKCCIATTMMIVMEY
jgi:hypothetical protein